MGVTFEGKKLGYEMLTMAQKICPTGKEQAGFAKLYNDAILSGCDDKELIITIVAAMCDGLFYGNWPTIEKEKE